MCVLLSESYWQTQKCNPDKAHLPAYSYKYKINNCTILFFAKAIIIIIFPPHLKSLNENLNIYYYNDLHLDNILSSINSAIVVHMRNCKLKIEYVLAGSFEMIHSGNCSDYIFYNWLNEKKKTIAAADVMRHTFIKHRQMGTV